MAKVKEFFGHRQTDRHTIGTQTNRAKQNRNTKGCSKLKRSKHKNIARPTWEGTRCQEEQASCWLAAPITNFPEYGNGVKTVIRSRSVTRSRFCEWRVSQNVR